MFFRALLVLLTIMAFEPVAGAAPASLSEERLQERADLIATGAVRRIFVSREGSRTEFIAEVTLESCAKGAYEEGDVVRVRYQGVAGAPFTVGSSGHTFRPRVGQRIDVFAEQEDEGFEALFPNGMREAEALVFVQVHDAEGYDALIEECLRTDRYLLGLEFAARRLGIGWTREASRAMFRFARRTGEHERAMGAFTDRLRAHPDDAEVLRLVTGLVWELRENREVFDDALASARDAEHAAVLGLLGMQLDWERDAGAFALYREALELDATLGNERLARSVYHHAIGAARDAGEGEIAERWLRAAREMFPEDEDNWSRFDRPRRR